MRELKFPSDYVLRNGVYEPQSKSLWTYNDGDSTENRLYEIVSTTDDLSCLSPELRTKIADWPTLYHLTPRRSNLLRPLSSILKGRILEIGAGCGAITRFLGETGAEIVAIEGSYRRASIARARTRDLSNVSVVAGNAQEIDFGHSFDVVTLIGVLEYARVFGSTHDPIDDLLKFARKLLKPSGVLIIAIENQLGLKYFAGALEDHKQQPFFGINDNYGPKTAVTFGKKELGQRIENAGFKKLDWLYPFPDYKLPTTILSSEGFRRDWNAQLAPLFSNSNFSDPQGPRAGLFSMEQAWDVVSRNGLVEDLANSFLVVCQQQALTDRASTAEQAALAWHFSVDRHPAFSKQVIFRADSKGNIRVERNNLCPGAVADLPFNMLLEEEKFILGQPFSLRLAKILNRDGWTLADVKDWFDVWLSALKERAGLEGNYDEGNNSVPGTLLDAMPFNLMIDELGQARFFDLEWEQKERIDVKYLAYRAMVNSLLRITSCGKPAQRRYRNIVLLTRKVLAESGMALSFSQLKSFAEADHRLKIAVKTGRFPLVTTSMVRTLAMRLKVRPAPIGINARIIRRTRKGVDRMVGMLDRRGVSRSSK